MFSRTQLSHSSFYSFFHKNKNKKAARQNRLALKELLLSFVAVAVLLLFFYNSSLTGYHTALPGKVTELSLTYNNGNPSVWKGLYGNLTMASRSTSVDLSSRGLVSSFDISLPADYSRYLFAFPFKSINWDSLEPASPEFLDSYLGIAASGYESGSSVFSKNKTFSILGKEQQLYYTTINAKDGNYEVVLLKYNNKPVFAAKLVDGIAFNGNKADYQILLPSTVDSTWYFALEPIEQSYTRKIELSGPDSIYAYLGKRTEKLIYAYYPESSTLKGDIRFSIAPKRSWISLRYVSSVENKKYAKLYLLPDATAAPSTDFIITATDGNSTVTKRLTVRIGYCGNKDSAGNPKCEALFEDCNSCPVDCGICVPSGRFMIMSLSSSCLGKQNITFYDAGYHDCKNPINVSGRLVCKALSDINIEVFKLKKKLSFGKLKKSWELALKKTITSNSYSLELYDPGEYKLAATKSGYNRYFHYFESVACSDKRTAGKSSKKSEEDKQKQKEKHKEMPLPSYRGYEKLIMLYATVLALLLYMVHRHFSRRK